MNIDWDIINKKYQKAFKMFCEFRKVKYNKTFDTNFYIESDFKHEDGSCLMLPEKICLCDLIGFFDKKEIYIDIASLKNGRFFYNIYFNDIDINQYSKNNKFYARKKTTILAFYKAFEILEKYLNGVK